MPNGKKKLNFRIIAILELVLIMILLTGYVFLLAFGQKEAPVQTVPTNADFKDPQIGGEERVRPIIEKEEIYYSLDGKKILLSDPTFGQIYIPVYENVPACSYDLSAMVHRNGYSFYTDNGSVVSKFGIDISAHQNTIDWKKVADAGVEFAIIRSAYRTYGGGELKADPKFKENIEGALANGIEVGVYVYSQAISVQEAIDEADFVLNQIKNYNITYPVVFDWEIVFDDAARTDKVSVETLTDSSISFCERIKGAGYRPMIYQNKRTSLLKLDLPRLQDYDFWLAEWNDGPTYYYNYQMWQYTEKGKIPGIEGNVDLNMCFENVVQ